MAFAVSARWRPAWPGVGWAVGAGSVAILAIASGLLIGHFGPAGALLPAVVLCLALTRYWLEAAPIAALLSVFVTTRVPGLGQSAGISVSDILVTLSTGLVLTQVRFTRPVRRLLVMAGAYELVLLAPVLVSGTRASYVEWLHRGELVIGAILCGALIAQRGRVLLALRALAVVAGVYAVAATVTYVRTGQAAFVLTLQKNGLGTLLMMVLMVSLHLRDLIPHRDWRWAYCGLLGAGIFASQSRGAMVAAAGGVLVAGLVEHRRLFRSPLVVLLALGSLVFVYLNVQSTEPVGEQLTYTSVGSRALYREQSLAIWRQSPITGAGLKLFNDPGSGLISEPHNVVVLALAEGGLFSLAAFIWLQVGALVVLRRHRSVLAAAAIAAVAARGTHGLLDIYWVGGTGSLCWLIAGMAVGAPALPRLPRLHPVPPPAIPAPPSPIRRRAQAPVSPVASAVFVPPSVAAARRSLGSGVEVLVVAYGRPELLEDAIRGLSQRRVVVVDNSSDGEVAEVARRYGATYIDPHKNLGFAAGVNRGLSEIPFGSDVLLLNPDARIEDADVDRLHERLHGAGVHLAAVAPVQRDPFGGLQRIEWPLPSPSLAWSEALGLHRLPGFRSRRAQFLAGSILLLNGAALEEVGRFDERFFLYAEESDWQRRALDLGWEVELVGSVTGFHIGAATSIDESIREIQFHASVERFIRKWHGPEGWARFRAAVIVGAVVRSILLGGDDAARRRRQALLYLRGPIRVSKRSIPR